MIDYVKLLIDKEIKSLQKDINGLAGEIEARQEKLKYKYDNLIQLQENIKKRRNKDE